MCIVPIRGDKSQLQDLFEQWVTGDEDWCKTRAFAKITNSSGKLENDVKDWVTRLELVQKMGENAADAMIAYMEQHNQEKIRDHPDAPGIKDSFTCIWVVSTNVWGKTESNLPAIPDNKPYAIW